MGCDIHLYKEKFIGNVWVSADTWVESKYEPGTFEVPYELQFSGRNYELFGMLSEGVRRTVSPSFVGRGIPFDACALVLKEIEDYGSDGHSHSYLYLHELKALVSYLADKTITIEGMKDKRELEEFKKSIASKNPDWGLLYPYCQLTSSQDYEDFIVEVPALYIVGNDLTEIIDSFEGVDGENHRIVFFFDN